jgi:hypothetical protein
MKWTTGEPCQVGGRHELDCVRTRRRRHQTNIAQDSSTTYINRKHRSAGPE